MKKRSRRHFLLGATGLATFPLYPTSVLRAQTRPCPPDLGGGVSACGDVATDSDGGAMDLINPPWTHATEPLGEAKGIPGVWNKSTDPDFTSSTVDWRITDSNPMIPGGRHFQTMIVKDDATNFRTERAEGRAPRNTEFPAVAGGHYSGPQKFWYAFLMRIDRADTFTSGHYCQFHSAGLGHSPNLALTARRNSGLWVRLEDNPDYGGETYYEGPVITTEDAIGKTHAIIWEVLWDTRSNAEGSEGIVRLYIDDNPNPVFEWLNKANCHNDAVSSTPRIPYFKYGLYNSSLKSSGTNGDTYIQNYTNYVTLGEKATRQHVLEALQWNLVVN